jgi:hypothetical protein
MGRSFSTYEGTVHNTHGNIPFEIVIEVKSILVTQLQLQFF